METRLITPGGNSRPVPIVAGAAGAPVVVPDPVDQGPGQVLVAPTARTSSDRGTRPAGKDPAPMALSARAVQVATISQDGFEIPSAPVSVDNWGSRSQIMGTLRDLADVLGNRDGLWDNEDSAPGTVAGKIDQNPLSLKIKEALTMGISTAEAVAILQEFRESREKDWGQPVSSLDAAQLKDGNLFLAQKAISLTRMGRAPAEVSDGFHLASGTVAGEKIDDRQLFFQQFKPTGPPSGQVIVVSPGFQETGRNFYEQIQEMNRQGHEVIVMDHQWAGQSEGSPGGMDRGFGVARDVAAMAACAHSILPNHEVVLFGNSMGAGPGVLGALTLNDNGLIQLNGPPMPQRLRAVLQAPYLEASDTLTNKLITVGSHIWGLDHIILPSSGEPVLTRDLIAAQKAAQSAVLEGVSAQLATMTKASKDIAFILKLIADGKGPQGLLYIVHGDHDPLANPQASRQLKLWMPGQVDLRIVPSRDHVLEQSPTEQLYGLDALHRLMLASR